MRKPATRYSSFIIRSSAFILAVAILTGCGGPRGEKKQHTQTVAVVTAELTTVTRTAKLLGTVQGEKQAMATSRIMGKVTRIARNEGAWVNEDDPIAWVVNDIPGMDYKPGPVRAPISGIVGKVYVEVGQTITPAMPVASVANYSRKVRVKVSISDHDLRFVTRGAEATVTVSALPDTVFTGRVTRVTPVLDPMNRTATVEITVENKTRELIPGMACSVELLLERHADVVAVPTTALFTNGFEKIVVVDNATARFREIETGLTGNELVEVVSGLAAGESVATTGKERVKDGEQVRTIEAGR